MINLMPLFRGTTDQTMHVHVPQNPRICPRKRMKVSNDHIGDGMSMLKLDFSCISLLREVE